ncbi:MAG: hypothetical protein IM613_12190 [Cytophagales bacterium]|jgi:hypothetical protein|nr:hypothetical protein [Cytophagales bacterium]
MMMLKMINRFTKILTVRLGSTKNEKEIIAGLQGVIEIRGQQIQELQDKIATMQEQYDNELATLKERFNQFPENFYIDLRDEVKSFVYNRTDGILVDSVERYIAGDVVNYVQSVLDPIFDTDEFEDDE